MGKAIFDVHDKDTFYNKFEKGDYLQNGQVTRFQSSIRLGIELKFRLTQLFDISLILCHIQQISNR